jgi:hypothetical protein
VAGKKVRRDEREALTGEYAGVVTLPDLDVSSENVTVVISRDRVKLTTRDKKAFEGRIAIKNLTDESAELSLTFTRARPTNIEVRAILTQKGWGLRSLPNSLNIISLDQVNRPVCDFCNRVPDCQAKCCQ